jgi:hypothetical protein
MTMVMDHKVQPPKSGKVGAGVLIAGIATVATVTYGSVGVAQACTPSASAPFTSCAYVQNNTGYTVYSYGGGSTPDQPLANGATFAQAVEMNQSVIFTFTMPANANTATATWTMTYNYEAGVDPNGIVWSAGSAPYPASFGTQLTKGVVNLTLGQDLHSFTTQSAGAGHVIESVDPVLGGTDSGVTPGGSPGTVRANVRNIVLGFTGKIPKFNVGPVQVGGALLANAYFSGYKNSATGLPGVLAYVSKQLSLKASAAGQLSLKAPAVGTGVPASRASRLAVAPTASLPVAPAATTPKAAAARHAPSTAKAAAPVRQSKSARTKG